MTPRFLPLLDRRACQDRRVLVAQYQLNPADDLLLQTAFEPGCHIGQAPRLPDDVRRHLVTVAHGRDEGSGRVVGRKMPLFLENGDQDLLPWGLTPLVTQAVRSRQGGAGPNELAASIATCMPSDLSDPLVVAQLLAHLRLIVRHGEGVGPAVLIADLVRALPGRRVAVVVARRRDGGDLVRQLRALGVDAGGFFSAGYTGATPPRVAVGTSSGLTSPDAQHARCSVVVTLDAVHFVGSGGANARYESSWLNAFWVGLVPPRRTVSALERDRLVAFFGPAALDLPAYGQVRRRVVFAPQTLTLPPGDGRDRLVMALAGELARLRPGVRSPRFAVVPQAADIPGPVVVLAHDEPHRRRLEQMRRADDCGRVHVVAPAKLAEVKAVGILVRADDRPHRPPLAPAALVEPQTVRSPLLVVDATGPGEERVARRRAANYRAEGWVSLAAFRGGRCEWERWVHRRQPGRRSAAAPESDGHTV